MARAWAVWGATEQQACGPQQLAPVRRLAQLSERWALVRVPSLLPEPGPLKAQESLQVSAPVPGLWLPPVRPAFQRLALRGAA